MFLFTKYRSTTYGTQKFSTRRVEAMTDGVFAIAMTLLVLDLDVSQLGHLTTDNQLWNALLNILGNNFISFVISFFILGIMWAIHVRQFEHIKYVNRHLMTINTIRLLAVVLIPFTTSLSSAYPDLFIAKILFPLNFLLLAVISNWQWKYATSNTKFYDPKELCSKAIKLASNRNMAFIIISLIVTVAAAFVGSWAFILFLAIPYLSMLLSRETLDDKK